MIDTLLNGLSYVGDSFDKMGSRQLRGVLGGKPRELASFIPFSDRLGITDEKDIVSGRDLLHNAGLVDKSTSGFGAGLAGAATEMALDPMSIVGGVGVAKRLLRPAASTFKQVRNLREPIALAKHIPSEGRDVMANTKLIGRGAGDDAALKYNAVLGKRTAPAATGGAYHPSLGLASVYTDIPSLVGMTGRHELMHGMIDQAVKTGNRSGLGVLGSTAARFGGSKNSLASGVHELLGETAARAAEKRGVLGQAGEAARFLVNPESHWNYGDYIQKHSPAVAMGWHAAPGAIAGGVGGAATGALANPDNPWEGALAGGSIGALGGGIASHQYLKPFAPTKSTQAAKAAFGLKYDHLANPPGNMPRTDPDWVNNRTFYHGTSQPGLSPSSLDITKTSDASLYGRGIYTTDEASFRPSNKITRGYALNRFGDKATEEMIDGKLFHYTYAEKLLNEGKIDKDFYRRVLGEWEGNEIADGEFYWPKRIRDQSTSLESKLEYLAKRFKYNYGSNEEMPAVLKDAYRLFGGEKRAKPTVYQAKSGFGKILELEEENPDLADHILSSYKSKGVDLRRVVDGDLGRHNEIKTIVGDAKMAGRPEILEKAIRDHGYDAMTHTGGQRTGNSYHQTLIGLNPQKYEKFEPMPPDDLTRIFGDSKHAIDKRYLPYDSKQMNDAADWLGPGWAPNRELLDAAKTQRSSVFGGKHSLHNALMGMENEDLARLMQELGPNARTAGMGAEAVAFRQHGGTPPKASQWATRIAPVKTIGGTTTFRPNLPEVLQPFRSNTFGQPGSYSEVVAEHLPWVNSPGLDFLQHDTYDSLRKALSRENMNTDAGLVRQAIFDNKTNSSDLAREFSDVVDRKYGGRYLPEDIAFNESNVSFLGGMNDPRILTHDAGAIVPSKSMGVPPSAPPYTPSRPGNQILGEAVGADAQYAIRGLMERAAATAGEGQGMPATPSMIEKLRKAMQAKAYLEDMLGKHADLVQYR
jgi:hypothetical protein